MKKWLIISICLVVISPSLQAQIYPEQKLKTINRIAKEYHRTHTYSKGFVCEDMAADVWNQLKTQGIKAKIVTGNLDRPDANFFEANHVWLMAEVSSDYWVIVETTSGQVGDITNTRSTYWRGFYFSTARQFKRHRVLRSKITEQWNRVSRMHPSDSQYAKEIRHYEWLQKEIAKTFDPLTSCPERVFPFVFFRGYKSSRHLGKGIKCADEVEWTSPLAPPDKPFIVSTSPESTGYKGRGIKVKGEAEWYNPLNP